MDTVNYIILIVGLALIGVFWNIISPKERKSETRIVTVSLFVLGVLAYIIQSLAWPII